MIGGFALFQVNSKAEAIEHAYAAVREISFEGMHFRTDIGAKGLKRYNKNAGMGT